MDPGTGEPDRRSVRFPRRRVACTRYNRASRRAAQTHSHEADRFREAGASRSDPVRATLPKTFVAAFDSVVSLDLSRADARPQPVAGPTDPG